MSRFLSDIIEGVISNIDNSLTAISVSGNTVVFEDLKYIELFNYIIKVDAGVATEIGMQSVNRQTNEATFSTAVGNFDGLYLPNCFYLAGTRYATNREWISASDRESDKLPLIWLHFNPFPTEVKLIDSDSPYSSEWKDVNVFFLDNYDGLNWITKDQIEYKIEPLRSLAYWFENSIRSLSCSMYFGDKLTLKHYPIFGSENMNGIDKKIIEADLTAVHARFDLKIKH